VGIISGLGVLAASLAWVRRRRKQNAATSVAHETILECIEIKEKPMSERPYCGPDGSQIVEQTANELIADPQLRQRWFEFDQRFLEQCVMTGEQGLVFNREGVAALGEVDAELLHLGVKIYNGANREAVRQRSTRYRVLNLLAMIYHSALRACQ
jgi:hypothetical protein